MKIADFITEDELNEGIHDPHTFNAIFMAGGPGSGKTTIGKKVASTFGLKHLDIDKAHEYLVRKKAIEYARKENVDDLDEFVKNYMRSYFYTKNPEKNRIQHSARDIKNLERKLWTAGGLGLVIDGTGSNFNALKNTNERLIKAKYQTMLTLVVSDITTAKSRNISRNRAVEEDYLYDAHMKIYQHIFKYEDLFKENFIMYNNTSEEGFSKFIENVANQTGQSEKDVKNLLSDHMMFNERDYFNKVKRFLESNKKETQEWWSSLEHAIQEFENEVNGETKRNNN